jgi:hypothetical protein
MSMGLMAYAREFRRLELIRDKMLKEFIAWIESVKEDVREEINTVDSIRDVQPSRNLVKLKFLDFTLCIIFDVCASKNIGFIKWFLEEPEYTDKPKMKLIFKHKFNHDGINSHTFENIYLYFRDTLSLFCEKIDQSEFDK